MAVRIPDPDAINLQLPGASAGIAGSVPRVNVEAGAQALQGAIGKFSDLALQAAEDASKDAALDRRNKAEAEIQDLLYNPEKGYFNRKGQDATAGLQDLSKQIDEIRTKHREGLNNRALQFYEPSVAGRASEVRGMALRHANQQAEEFAKQAYSGRMALEEKAFANGETPTAEKVGEINSLIAERARRDGLKGPALEALKMTEWSRLRAAQIEFQLSERPTKPADVQEATLIYLQAKKAGELSAADIDKYGDRLATKGSAVDGQRVAREVWDDKSFKTDEQRTKAISEKLKNSPEAMQFALAHLNVFRGSRDRDDRVRVGGAIEKVMIGELTKDQIKTQSWYTNLEADDRVRVLQAAEHEERLKKAGKEEKLENFAAYMDELDSLRKDPQRPTSYFAAAAEKIGPTYAKQLLVEQKNILNKANDFHIPTSEINAYAVNEVGLNDKSDPKSVRAYAGLVNAATMKWKAEHPGKLPSDEEKQKLLRAPLESAEIPRSWWFGTEKAPLYDVVAKGKGAQALPPESYIEAGMKEVPGATRKDIIDFWRKKNGITSDLKGK